MRLMKKTLWRAALVMLSTAGTLAEEEYLPEVGPSTPRFKAPAAYVNLAEVLPPLKMDDKKPFGELPGGEDLLGPRLPEDPGPQEREMVQLEDMPGTPLEPAQPERTPEAAQTQQVPLTPQMFMRFFNQSGSREAVVQAPVDFTPPAPARGSSATYIVK